MDFEIRHPTQNPVLSCKDWSLKSLLVYENFTEVPRISVSDPKLQEVITQNDNDGVPLVIDRLHSLTGWDEGQLSIEWLKNFSEIKEISVRNIHNNVDTTLSFSEFIKKSRDTPQFVQPGETERLYGKDLETPKEWNDWLCTSNVVPHCLLPTTDNILTYLPQSSLVDTLMCYIGSGDTFTPSHKDLCASNGQNLMCYAEEGGSSFWFMTEQKDARKVADYFHNKLRNDIDHESHITSVEDFANAPFKVYVVEQKVGDLVLVPRMSCHQVVNFGGLTVKMSWSRMTVKGAEQALYHELPLYRRVCRPEIYRIRSLLYYTMKALTKQISENESATDIERLCQALSAFDDVLIDESDPNHASLPCLSSSDVNLSCDFCGADIFQSFFECEACHSADSTDSCTICPGCYAEGRSCRCQEMQPRQVRSLDTILRERDEAIKTLQRISHSVVKFAEEKQLFAGGAFSAGCHLAKLRKQEMGGITCNKGSASRTHKLSFGDIIHCKDCHRSSCYFHLLKDCRLHSIETLLNARNGREVVDDSLSGERKYEEELPIFKDKERKAVASSHHDRHTLGKRRYEEGLPNFEDKERKAERLDDLEVQRVNLALSFPICRPVNTCCTSGWYDSIIVAPVTVMINRSSQTNNPHSMLNSSPPPPYAEEASNGHHNNNNNSSNGDSSSFSNANPGMTAGPSNPTNTAESSSGTVTSASSLKPPKAKRRRIVMDYVLVEAQKQSVKPPSSTSSSVTKDHGVIEVSSDELPSPRLAAKKRRVDDAVPGPSNGPPARLRGEHTSAPAVKTNGRRAVRSSNFMNDLASVITASAAASTHEEEAAIPSASTTALPRASTSSRPVAPKKAKRVEAAKTDARSSVSSGKKRHLDDNSSEEEDGPMVAEPHIPPAPAKPPPLRKKPVVAFGKKKNVQPSVTARSTVGVGSSHDSLIFRSSQSEDRGVVSAGPVPRSKGNSVGDGLTSSHASVKGLSNGHPLPGGSKKRKEPSSSNTGEEPIAESSRMALNRQRSAESNEHIGAYQPASTFLPPNTDRFNGASDAMVPLSMFWSLMASMQQRETTEVELRARNLQLSSEVEQLRLENARNAAQQQQQPQPQQQQSLDHNAFNLNYALIQGTMQTVLPTMIHQSVESSLFSTLNKMVNTPQVPEIPSAGERHLYSPPQANSRYDNVRTHNRGSGYARRFNGNGHGFNGNGNGNGINNRRPQARPYQVRRYPPGPSGPSRRRSSSRDRYPSPRESTRRQIEHHSSITEVEDSSQPHSSHQRIQHEHELGPERESPILVERIEMEDKDRHGGHSNDDPDHDPQDWEGSYDQDEEDLPRKNNELVNKKSKSNQLPKDVTHNPW